MEEERKRRGWRRRERVEDGRQLCGGEEGVGGG
jgi:hypothetical protein